MADDSSHAMKQVYDLLDRHGPATLDRLADIVAAGERLTPNERKRLKNRLFAALDRLRARNRVEAFGEKPRCWTTAVAADRETPRKGAVQLRDESLREHLEWRAAIRQAALRRRRAGAWQAR